jgi:hypothetical protein
MWRYGRFPFLVSPNDGFRDASGATRRSPRLDFLEWKLEIYLSQLTAREASGKDGTARSLPTSACEKNPRQFQLSMCPLTLAEKKLFISLKWFTATGPNCKKNVCVQSHGEPQMSRWNESFDNSSDQIVAMEMIGIFTYKFNKILAIFVLFASVFAFRQTINKK